MNNSIIMEADVPNNTGSGLHESLDHLNARYAHALIPFAFVMAIFSAVGVIGNTIVILIFSICKEYRNTNFRIFAISLACVDLMSCVILMPAEIIKTRNYFSNPNPMPCKVKCFFTLFTQSAASLMLLVICIDRFRKVCQPLKKQIWPGLATKILIVVAVLSFLIALPAPLLCGISEEVKMNTFNTNTTVYICAAEEKHKTSLARSLYKLGCSFIFIAISLAFIVMYSLIMRIVVKHWGNTGVGQSVRFESSRTPEPSDRVEADRLTDDVFSPEELKAIAECERGNNPDKLASDSRNQRKLSKERAPIRKISSFSINGVGLPGRHSLRKNSVNAYSSRSGSDVSFRVHSFRGRSSSVSGRIPYKTLIWFILTIIFIVTYLVNAVLSFFTTAQYTLSSWQLVLYSFFFRIYFINNIINPVIYASLDKRFNTSCRKLMTSVKRKLCHCC